MKIEGYQPIAQGMTGQKDRGHQPNQVSETKNSSPAVVVSLSAQAEQVMKAGKSYGASDAVKTQQNTEAGTLPLEKYAIPDWYADYGFELSSQLGSRGNAFADLNPKAASVDEETRNEYSALVRQHYRDVLDNHGINSTEAHYQALIADKNTSESLRQEMAERVRADARLMELVNQLGKTDILTSGIA